MPGVSFAGAWEIGTPSTVVRELWTVTSVAGDEDLRVRASIADVEVLGSSAPLEDGWKTWATPLCDSEYPTAHITINYLKS